MQQYVVKSRVAHKPGSTTNTVTDSSTYTTIGSLFNNSEYSDCRLIFNKSANELFLHKTIICSQSGFFKMCFKSGMMEAEQNTVYIDVDEDEALITELMKSMYTSQLTINNDTDIVSLILLAEKYLMNTKVESLTTYLTKNINANNVLQCVHLNLEKYTTVKTAFDNYVRQHANAILDGKSYLSLNVQQFLPMISLLVNTTNGMKGVEAINNWIEYDESERAGYSYALSKEVQKAAKVSPNQNVRGNIGF